MVANSRYGGQLNSAASMRHITMECGEDGKEDDGDKGDGIGDDGGEDNGDRDDGDENDGDEDDGGEDNGGGRWRWEMVAGDGSGRRSWRRWMAATSDTEATSARSGGAFNICDCYRT